MSGYPDLENAAAEVRSVVELRAAPELLVLRDGEAQRPSVRAALSRAQVAHFACHGEFFPERPHASGLVLADGLLSVADVRTQRLDALDVVALSSCWVGNVAVLPGRELVGVHVAFLEQGAGLVIASLWKVFDDFSLKLTKELFTALRTQSSAEALSYVQRQLMATTRPRDWGSYVAYLGGLVPPWSARLRLRLRSLARF